MHNTFYLKQSSEEILWKLLWSLTTKSSQFLIDSDFQAFIERLKMLCKQLKVS